jgi:hypothetical protein
MKNVESWLRCTLSAGQFPNEYGVDGMQFNQEPFSLFVPQMYTKSDQPPTVGKPVKGWVKVSVVERQGDLVLVFLPRPTFQNGPYVTVKPEQLEGNLSETPRASKQRNGRR